MGLARRTALGRFYWGPQFTKSAAFGRRRQHLKKLRLALFSYFEGILKLIA